MAEGDYEVAEELAQELGIEAQDRERWGLTDLGHAKLFASLHASDVRFCFPWGKWLVWDGQRWQEDQTGEIYRKARVVVQELLDRAAERKKAIADELTRVLAGESDGEELKHLEQVAKAFWGWAKQSASVGRIDAMIKLAQSEAGIAVLPEQLDADPWLFNAANGSVELKTGQLREHRRGDLLTKLALVSYGPGAACPLCASYHLPCGPAGELGRHA